MFSSLPLFPHSLDPIAIRVPKSPLPLIHSALKFLIAYDGLRAAGKGIPRRQIFQQLRRRHLRIHRPPPPQIVSQLIMPFLYLLGYYLSFFVEFVFLVMYIFRYGSRATARDFEIYAPNATFEDPLMCAHG